MEKRNSRKSEIKKLFFNKFGMTYVELICALALLSLIVVMFTPMLLSSYETLYKAGEEVEGVYDSKEEIEEQLATRYSTNTISISDYAFTTGLDANAKQLFEILNVKGKKAVSTMQHGLETVFGTTRASIDIVSPSIVYDDKSNHDVIIQTSGLEYSTIKFGSYAEEYGDIASGAADAAFEAEADKTEGGLIFVEVLIPDKKADKSEESFYESKKSNLAQLKFDGSSHAISNTDGLSISHNKDDGKIAFNIKGNNTSLDFTQSPIKISIYYVNTRGVVKTTSDFLTIEPPTMIFAGETDSSVDYYTSAGVEEDTVVINGERTNKFSITYEGRKMRVANSGLFSGSDTPGGKSATIKTVAWIDNDENPYLNPYYVMAGTDSSVYRMYNYKVDTNLKTALGSSNTPADTTDGTIAISDGSLVTPSFWSGEMSDQYSFQTLYHATTYGLDGDNNEDCSAPDSRYGVIGTKYDEFDKNLRYSMMFNSFRTGYNYASQMSRRISYVLSEAGSQSFRIAGKKQGDTQFTGYNQIWEQSGHYDLTNSTYTDDGEVQYFYTGTGTTNPHTDMHMAFLRLSSYTQVNPLDAKQSNTKTYSIADGSETNAGTATLYDRFVTGGEFWSPSGQSEESVKGLSWKDRVNYISTEYGTKVNVTSAVYLPGSGSSGAGQVIYFGTVPAYGLIRESSDIVTGQDRMFNCNSRWFVSGELRESAATIFLICGTQGNGSTIYRNAFGGASGNKSENVDAHNYMRAQIEAGSVSSQTNEKTFYTTGNDSQTYKLEKSDLEFTFGYCSRWRMSIGDVTFNGTTEEARSYEKYYKASYHSSDSNLSTLVNDKAPSGGINAGKVNNLYYNVWFPGEYYNLVDCVTVDEVTVAVGYTVSGSSYMSQSAYASNYYGTALGSVYNDAVLAAYISEDVGGVVFSNNLGDKGKRNAIFQNVLYYKSPAFTDSQTHSRQSVRFTAVGAYSSAGRINPSINGPQTVTKSYVAIYGDSLGNAYYSIIATSSVTGKYVDKKDSNGNIVYDENGQKVQEWVGEESGLVLRSEENGNALKTNEMYPITIGGNLLSTYFTEITTIVAEEGFVVISGKPRGGTYDKEMIVVCYSDADGNYTFKMVENSSFTGYINDAKFIGNYYYFVGGDENGGWCAAIDKQELINLAKKSGDAKSSWSSISVSTQFDENDVMYTTDPSKLIYFQTPTIINAFDGRVHS